jgi:hypothetical protein
MTEHEHRYPIEEHMAFQRADWRAERIGWIVVWLIVLAALSGLLAYGPLSAATATDASHRLTVSYQRFQRVTVTTNFTFHVAAGEGPIVLRLGPHFTTDFELDSLQPMPTASTQGPDGLTLTFARPAQGDFTAVLWARPRRFGLVDLNMSLAAQPAIDRTILIYP